MDQPFLNPFAVILSSASSFTSRERSRWTWYIERQRSCKTQDCRAPGQGLQGRRDSPHFFGGILFDERFFGNDSGRPDAVNGAGVRECDVEAEFRCQGPSCVDGISKKQGGPHGSKQSAQCSKGFFLHLPALRILWWGRGTLCEQGQRRVAFGRAGKTMALEFRNIH